MTKRQVVETLCKYYGPGCDVWCDGHHRFGSGLWEAGVPTPNGKLFEIIASAETLDTLNSRIVHRFLYE